MGRSFSQDAESCLRHVVQAGKAKHDTGVYISQFDDNVTSNYVLPTNNCDTTIIFMYKTWKHCLFVCFYLFIFSKHSGYES